MQKEVVEPNVETLADAQTFGQDGLNDRFIAVVYDELRSLARRKKNRQSPALPLDTTELVHEAWLKLTQHKQSPNDRGHFFSLVAMAMRHVLVDLARREFAAKRGGGQLEVTFNEEVALDESQLSECLAVDQALVKLTEINEGLVKVVECRYFAGLTEQQTAEALNVTTRTVQRHWRRARMWLHQFLSPEAA